MKRFQFRNRYPKKAILGFGVKLLLSATQRRHLVRWLVSLRDDYLLDTPCPWIAFDAIDFVKDRLSIGARVFEYGSGGSTLFWLSRGLTCVSIEHDPQWYELVCQRIVSSIRLDYRLVQPEQTNDLEDETDIANPEKYRSGDERFRRHQFRRYVTQIDEFPDEYFDLVVVDGRSRPSCLMHSVNKVRKGGMIVLDNAERSYYTEQAGKYLAEYTIFEFWGASPAQTWFTKTNVYMRN